VLNYKSKEGKILVNIFRRIKKRIQRMRTKTKSGFLPIPPLNCELIGRELKTLPDKAHRLIASFFRREN
jgi:hypothetical protein